MLNEWHKVVISKMCHTLLARNIKDCCVPTYRAQRFLIESQSVDQVNVPNYSIALLFRAIIQPWSKKVLPRF